MPPPALFDIPVLPYTNLEYTNLANQQSPTVLSYNRTEACERITTNRLAVYTFRLISIEMHTCMSRQQWNLVYTLGEEVPKLVYAFLMCKSVDPFYGTSLGIVTKIKNSFCLQVNGKVPIRRSEFLIMKIGPGNTVLEPFKIEKVSTKTQSCWYNGSSILYIAFTNGSRSFLYGQAYTCT